MTRRRSMNALLGTLALVAGCSTTQRTEVSGVVRDRSTGRVIPGARVIGADGALARTDQNGRFTLFVRPGSSADLRVSAEGHASERVEAAGLDAEVELAPIAFSGESFVIQGAEPVVGWGEETWAVLEGPASVSVDAGSSDAARSELGVVGDLDVVGDLGVVGVAAHEHSAVGAECETCHRSEAQLFRAGTAHVGLADTCLACHAFRLGPDARASCGRCHGAGVGIEGALSRETASLASAASAALERSVVTAARAHAIQSSCGGVVTRFTQVMGFAHASGAFVLVDAEGEIVGDCDRDGVRGDDEAWVDLDQLDEGLGSRVRELARIEGDRSGGAHAPDFVRASLVDLAR